MKRVKPGGVIEVSLLNGSYAYLQVVSNEEDGMDILRTFAEVLPSPIENPRTVLSLQESYIFFSMTRILLEDKRFRLIGYASLPQPATVPAFIAGCSRRGLSVCVSGREFSVWPLTDEYANLTDNSLIPAGIIVERFVGGWTPKDDAPKWVSTALLLAQQQKYQDDQEAFNVAFWDEIERQRQETYAKLHNYNELMKKRGTPEKQIGVADRFNVYVDFPNRKVALQASKLLDELGYSTEVRDVADNGEMQAELRVSISAGSGNSLQNEAEILESRVINIADQLHGKFTGNEYRFK